MFVGEKVLLDVGFPAARAKLAKLAGGLMLRVAEAAYGEGAAGLARSGAGPGVGMSRLIRVQLGEMATAADGARLGLRWEAIGPGGGLFAALDADLTLIPCAEEACVLALAGVYRSPPGQAGVQASVLTLAGGYRPPHSLMRAELDRAIWRRCAAATVQGFLARLGCVLAHPAGRAEPDGVPSARCPRPGAGALAGGATIEYLRWPGRTPGRVPKPGGPAEELPARS